MDKKKRRVRPQSSITWEERQEMIDKYLSGGYSKAEIWEEYVGDRNERGLILRWMRRLGYDTSKITQQRQVFPTFDETMSKKKKDTVSKELSKDELLKQNKELKKRLEMAELQSEAYRLTIEIAEKELKLPIRKKSNTK